MFQHKTDIYCEHQSYQERGEILSLKPWNFVKMSSGNILISVKGGNQMKMHLLRLICTHSIILWHYESFDGDSVDKYDEDNHEGDGEDDQEHDGEDDNEEEDESIVFRLWRIVGAHSIISVALLWLQQSTARNHFE